MNKRKSIIFSAPMVRAILREIEKPGTGKTQTRRVLTANCDESPAFVKYGTITALDENDEPYRWPRTHAIADHIYVKEAWRTFVSLENVKPRDIWSHGCGHGAGILYESDQYGLAITKDGERWEGHRDDPNAFGKLRSPMFMPRWASRITLIVTDVRVERLQSIGVADCYAEGCFRPDMSKALGSEVTARDNARNEYRKIWDSINSKTAGHSWAISPWVAVYSFNVIMANIDQAE